MYLNITIFTYSFELQFYEGTPLFRFVDDMSVDWNDVARNMSRSVDEVKSQYQWFLDYTSFVSFIPLLGRLLPPHYTRQSGIKASPLPAGASGASPSGGPTGV